MTGLPGRGTGSDTPPPALVHGLAGDLVAPDWPVLTDEEARWVSARWALGDDPDVPPVVVWRSPRPLSAAGLVRVADGRVVFVKRHDPRVRSVESLDCEHRFARHLRERGITVPEVLTTPDGVSAVAVAESARTALAHPAPLPGASSRTVPQEQSSPDPGLGPPGESGTPAPGAAVYEVHACAPGDDRYRDAESWTGF